MNPIEFFKNFPMGTEIDIAGSFIYNGIKGFNQLHHFDNECEIFHILYNMSVGIERLQKVLIVLHEDITGINLEDFEKSLITHSHQELQHRIEKFTNIKLNPIQYKFLQLLTNFYITCRYARFSLSNNYSQERDLLTEFISSNLNIKIITNDIFFTTHNNDRIKDFIGRIVGSISKEYYRQISKQARHLGLYTYELRVDSPAGKIFLPSFSKNSLQEQYINEQVSIKEFIIFLMNTKDTNKYYQFLKSIDPLSIDIALAQEYLADICKGEVPSSLIEQIDFLYNEDIPNIKDRLELINVVGNTSYIFDMDDEDDENDEKSHEAWMIEEDDTET